MDIAVLIVTYNQAEYVGRAIDSVLEQTHPPDQVVVADDGSVDGTQAIVREYATRHPDTVIPVLADENRGIPKNLNDGLRAVSADAVTWIAGDDYFRREKLEREAAAIERDPNVGVAYSNFAYVDEDRTEIGRWANDGRRPPTGDVLAECLARDWPNRTLFRNPMVDWSVLEEVGFYDESLAIFEDWDMKIRLSAVTEVAYCDAVLTEYRRHDEGISASSDWTTKARSTERIREKHARLVAELDADRQERVFRKLDGFVRRLSAFAAAEQGDVGRALEEYALAIRAQPRQALNYGDHLRLLLPEKMFEVLRRSKHRIDKAVKRLSRSNTGGPEGAK